MTTFHTEVAEPVLEIIGPLDFNAPELQSRNPSIN